MDFLKSAFSKYDVRASGLGLISSQQNRKWLGFFCFCLYFQSFLSEHSILSSEHIYIAGKVVDFNYPFIFILTKVIYSSDKKYSQKVVAKK